MDLVLGNNQKLVLIMLTNMGIQADGVFNGRQAIEALEKTKYELLLMDIQMPEMDGFEATRAIHQRFGPDQRPVIIALTAHAMRGYQDKCLEAGMDDYVSKPLRIAPLRKVLQRFADARGMKAAEERRAGRKT